MMRETRHMSLLKSLKKATVILLVSGMTQYVFAVDGTMHGSASSKSARSSYSSLKKDLHLSLHSGFNFNSNKSFNFHKVNRVTMFNSVVTYQKGNVTYFLPYKHKTVLQKFKTPTAPAIR